jgi:hypothetical protein
MPGITKLTAGHIETARTESKHRIKLEDTDGEVGLSPIVTLLKLAIAQTLSILVDISPDWGEAVKLFNHLTVKAPIASLTGSKSFRIIDDGAFKLPNGMGDGHQRVIDIFSHPSFPDGDGNTYLELTNSIGITKMMSLASTVLWRLLGQQGVLFEQIRNYPKCAFIFAVHDLLDSHYIVDEHVQNSR